jgi:hypothetical protein
VTGLKLDISSSAGIPSLQHTELQTPHLASFWQPWAVHGTTRFLHLLCSGALGARSREDPSNFLLLLLPETRVNHQPQSGSPAFPSGGAQTNLSFMPWVYTSWQGRESATCLCKPCGCVAQKWPGRGIDEAPSFLQLRHQAKVSMFMALSSFCRLADWGLNELSHSARGRIQHCVEVSLTLKWRTSGHMPPVFLYLLPTGLYGEEALEALPTTHETFYRDGGAPCVLHISLH